MDKTLIFFIITILLSSCCVDEFTEYPISNEIRNLIPYHEDDTLKFKHSNGSSIELYAVISESINDVSKNGERSCKKGTAYRYDVTLSNPTDTSLKISWGISTYRQDIDVQIGDQYISNKYLLNPVRMDTNITLHDSILINGKTYNQVYELTPFSEFIDSNEIKSFYYNYTDQLLKIEFYSNESYSI